MLRYWGYSKCSGNTFDWFMRLHILQATYSWPHLGPFSILPQTIKQGWWMGVAPLHMQTFTYLAAGPEQEDSPSLNHLFVAYPALCGFVSDLEWVKSLSRVWLCNPMDCSLPGSSIHGIFQARVLEWVAISFSRGSSQPRDQTQVSHIIGKRLTIWATREVFVSDLSCWVKVYQGTAFSLVLVYF